MNIRKELVDHIEDRNVLYVHIKLYRPMWTEDDDYEADLNYPDFECQGSLAEVLPMLDLDYNNDVGVIQEVHGYIWYEDGTWSERCVCDEGPINEWWEYKKCPEMPTCKDRTHEDIPLNKMTLP